MVERREIARMGDRKGGAGREKSRIEQESEGGK